MFIQIQLTFCHEYSIHNVKVTLNEKHLFEIVRIALQKYFLESYDLNKNLAEKFEDVEQTMEIIDENSIKNVLSCHEWMPQMTAKSCNIYENINDWVCHDIAGYEIRKVNLFCVLHL